MAKASVREISRITGFSPATVSNALNRKRSVSEETAKVILECARSLGYQQSTQLESIQFVLARKTGAILDESTFHRGRGAPGASPRHEHELCLARL